MTYASTILIVDDEPSARDTLEALLVNQGYRLAFAANGVEALSKAAELGPDLILLDVMMPVMDGFEVCQRLRADPLLAEAPIVMVTALDDRASRLRGLEAGADDFVSKPFDRDELRARVRTITRLNRYRRLMAERVRFEWVTQHASDGYLIVRGPHASGGRCDEVIYANAQARLYLNLPEQGLIEAKFLEVVKTKYHCEPDDAWADWPAAGMPAQRYLVQPESPAAKAFWLQVDLFDLPTGPDAERLIRLRDITTQVNLRSEVWGFHSAISHKLRTPLVILLNSLELQARHMTDLPADEIAQLSEMALNSVNRLRSDVADILQYLNASILARPGEGFALSQLPTLVAEIGAFLGLKSVTVSVEPGLAGARLALSARGVELALWEILENAIKFHPAQSPQVDVVASCRGDSSQSCAEAGLRIGDDGLTLSPEQLAQVWFPYYQAEKYHTGQVAGVGLGLSVVASLVWGVGGTCRMYNRAGQPGVIVELVLPAIREGEP